MDTSMISTVTLSLHVHLDVWVSYSACIIVTLCGFQLIIAVFIMYFPVLTFPYFPVSDAV